MSDHKAGGHPPRLQDVDLGKSLSGKAYAKRLHELQIKLIKIQQAYLVQGRTAVVVFEGWDAAGKGGTIRRISTVMDPRNFKVWPIGAPRPYYLDRHYLVRFVERLPPRGAISVFDRSWYGRVLVERIEGLTSVSRWRSAYREIADFERMLVDDGTRVAKVFFHISPDVQLHRLEERVRDPLKRWKLSYEDFRNRQRWDDYTHATDEMLEKTSTSFAPWCVVPSNDKKFGRIAAIEEVVSRLGRDVDLSPPRLDESVIEAANSHFELSPSLMASLRGRTE